MPKCDNTQIAGYKTARDWRDFKDEHDLPVNTCPKIRAMAFDGYFAPRLETRYLHPIEVRTIRFQNTSNLDTEMSFK